MINIKVKIYYIISNFSSFIIGYLIDIKVVYKILLKYKLL